MNKRHRTLNLNEAAEFLHMSPAVLRQKASLGTIHGAKPGKRWVFLEADLADYLRSLYPSRGQAPQSDTAQEIKPCRSTNAVIYGGCDSAPPTASEYASLLKLPIGS
ncbi:MAG: helix-turn-helix domain-containing protein [Chromatiaceae bacterium]|nr:helix-turn-helix domain-containing protein [Chromatiaceae bacterium]MCP5443416.1 helix-turn-helix domain-containing protein [Chromatiaceae bacterium]